jgi:hypothetical protein
VSEYGDAKMREIPDRSLPDDEHVCAWANAACRSSGVAGRCP